MNESFLPIKEEGHILWPLNFEVEGEIIVCEGKKSTRESRDYRLRLPAKIQSIAPRAFDIFGDIAIIKLPYELEPHFATISKSIVNSNTNIDKVAIDLWYRAQVVDLMQQLELSDTELVAKDRANSDLTIIDWSQAERDKLRKIAEGAWADYAASSPLAKEAFESVQAFLKRRGML